MTYHGGQSYASGEAWEGTGGFEKRLGIRKVLADVRHQQTNCRLERPWVGSGASCRALSRS